LDGSALRRGVVFIDEHRRAVPEIFGDMVSVREYGVAGSYGAVKSFVDAAIHTIKCDQIGAGVNTNETLRPGIGIVTNIVVSDKDCLARAAIIVDRDSAGSISAGGRNRKNCQQ
jgi:hypothetical protein